MTDLIVNNRSPELTCYDHQVEPHGQCSEWVGLRQVSSSLEERWPGLGCIPVETHESRMKENKQQMKRFCCFHARGFNAAPQMRASSYASPGRGCC